MQLSDDSLQSPPGMPMETKEGSPPFAGEGGKKRILIIEDEQAFRDILSANLAKEGYQTESAMDGIEGLEKMRLMKPDLVLLDIVMPHKDGFSFLEDMKADQNLNDIPIIVLSNSGDQVELSRAKKMGVKDILVKTVFGPQELLTRVRRVLSPESDAVDALPSQEGTLDDDGTYRLSEDQSVLESTPEGNAPKGLKGHILLVEDDPFLWTLIQSKLIKEGFEVTIAKDGQECLDKVKTLKPLLILLDIILPDMSGFSVLESLKADWETKAIPVIVLSNLGQQEDIAKGIALGAKDYLIKAQHAPQEIVDKIKKVLAGE